MSSQDTPRLGDPLPPFHKSRDTLELLSRRRSTTVATMGEPGPSAGELETILACASRVPDHRRVVPYRFIVFGGEAREKAGMVMKDVYKRNTPDAEEQALAVEGERFLRAPVVIAVVASTNRDHKTPEWEQILTCGAVCQNLLLAASASGFAGQWLTEWIAYDRAVLSGFGLKAHEQIAGYIYLGTAREDPLERPRVEVADITQRWG